MSVENIEYVIKCGEDLIDAGTSCHVKARAELAALRADNAALKAQLRKLEIPCDKCSGSGFVYDNVCDCSGGSIGYATPEIIATLETQNAQQAERMSDLLAVIHRDGGQHERLHGVNSPLIAQRIVVEAYQRIAELESALAYDGRHCPLCTWRGKTELADGVCPQCGVDWPALYASGRDERSAAKERIAELETRLSATHSEHDAARDEWHAALKRIAELGQAVNEARSAMLQIVARGGNLDDDRLTYKTGPNDAVGRGLMYVAARCFARAWLAAHPAQATEDAK